MRSSWWDLGEDSGQSGNELALYQISCAFCSEKGNWKLVHRSEKKKPNGEKVIFFDTYECGNCKGYSQVMWSATEMFGHHGLHDYRAQPWLLRVGEPPEHWPENIKRFWKQAKKSLLDENWDAAATMARSALQYVMRDKGAKKGSLYDEIEDLVTKDVLPPLMKDWSHEIRELGNDSSHPDLDQGAPDEKDAKDIVEFLERLLEYIYDLPKQITDYRTRKKSK